MLARLSSALCCLKSAWSGAWHSMSSHGLVSQRPCRLSTADLQLQSLPVLLHAKPGVLQLITTLFLRKTNDELHLEKREMAASDLVMAELVNNRGPVALLRAEPGDEEGQRQLLQCSADLLTCGQLLVLASPSLDMVLLPRQAAAADGVPFLLFLTHCAGVEWMADLVRQRQLGVILDLDATLLESVMLDLTTRPENWFELDWTETTWVTSAGDRLPGYYASLPGEAGAQSVHAVTWVRDNLSHDYGVRVRPGWDSLKACLIEENAKFRSHVCSLGRPVYVQAVTTILDPAHELWAKDDPRIISARPDGCYNTPEKSPAVGVGLVPPNSADYNMRFPCTFAADDIPEYYSEATRDVVYRIDPYKPAANPPSGIDAGDELSILADTLRSFWAHCYGPQGDGGAVAVLKLCTAELLQKLQIAPWEDPNWLLFYEFLFDTTGRTCWANFSVETFLQQQEEQAGMLAQALEDAGPDVGGLGEDGAGLLLPEDHMGSEEVLAEAENLPLLSSCPSSKMEVHQAQPVAQEQAPGLVALAAAAAAAAARPPSVLAMAPVDVELLALPAAEVHLPVWHHESEGGREH